MPMHYVTTDPGGQALRETAAVAPTGPKVGGATVEFSIAQPPSPFQNAGTHQRCRPPLVEILSCEQRWMMLVKEPLAGDDLG